MLYDPKHARHADRLEDELRAARALTPELMSEVIAQACVRLHAHQAAAKTRINRLIESTAWADATLALLELELPQWKLRRLVCEDGEWVCTLSREPSLPLGLDEAAEATHEIMPLAILLAFLEARQAASARAASSTAVPQVRASQGQPACCDNFG